jgi:Rrf2 family iron-sulfur cluster assembly transcriptional regulator
MRINKKLELAIRAIKALQTRNSPTRTQDLAVEIGTTLHFLEQIMRNLRTAGLVTSVRGPGGGYVLTRRTDGSSVNAGEVAAAVEKKSTQADPSNTSPENRLRLAIDEAFRSTTI